MKFSIVIPTYNRAGELRATLRSLSKLESPDPWEVIVADNNSTDDTRQVVLDAATGFPVELRYVFEREQGRSAALNAAIRESRGSIIVTTDDDVRVAPDWLSHASDALERFDCDYVGGRVLPLWGAPRPEWIPNHGGKQWAVIALLDYGDEPIPFFTQAHRVPLGVNMAFRREAFDRAGLWDNRVGRRKGTLLGQEVREWMSRARDAGLRGWYAPAMTVRHVIQADRLNKRYFRRWYHWNGISRALMYRNAWIDMQAPESAEPRFLSRTALPRRPALLLPQGGARGAPDARAGVARRRGSQLRCRVVVVVLQRRRGAALEGSPPDAAAKQQGKAGRGAGHLDPSRDWLTNLERRHERVVIGNRAFRVEHFGACHGEVRRVLRYHT